MCLYQIDYDQPPFGNFNINPNSGKQFLQMVGLTLGVNMGSNHIEIIYRYLNLTSSKPVRFMSFLILNEQAMYIIFFIALSFLNTVHLYTTVSRVDLAINLNAEPHLVEEYVNADSK